MKHTLKQVTRALFSRLKANSEGNQLTTSTTAAQTPSPELGATAQRHDLTFNKRSYRRSRDRQYRVFTPSQYHNNKPLPLVMVLHGCFQDHLEIERISKMSELAEENDFLVVYPFVTGYDGMRGRFCWGWWLAAQTRRGAGEVEDLSQIVDEVKADFNVDPARVYVCGLSAGAGMAAALMVTHPEQFAAGASVAGVAYGESANAVTVFGEHSDQLRSVDWLTKNIAEHTEPGISLPPLIIIHSQNDKTVSVKAAQNLRDSWANSLNISLDNPSTVIANNNGYCQWQWHKFDLTIGQAYLETVILEGPDHGWYGGAPGEYSFPDAFDASSAIWNFFQEHPRKKQRTPASISRLLANR